jgi:hypothetical protein
MKQVRLSVAITVILFAGCRSEQEQTKAMDSSPKPALISHETAVEASTRVKPFSLTFHNLIENNRLNGLPVLAKQEFDSYFVEAIDENFTDEYKYHLLEEVVNTPAYKMRLIAREYENENTVWLCLFDRNRKIQEAKEVYYDNAEGNYQVEAVLKNDTLTLFMDDVNEGKYKEVYTFGNDFKLRQVNTEKK